MSLSYEQMGGTVEDLVARISDWSSDQIESFAGLEILSAAVMMGRRSDDGRHDRAATAAYKVLTARNEGYRYQRAWNGVMREQGHSVSQGQRDAAKPPREDA